MNGSEVQGSLREMWETRPARPREGRQVAGVAAAIARRYGIDPVLVRIGFVVAGFYGVGLALYVAGWLLLPDGTDSGTDRAGPPKPVVIVGLAVLGLLSFGAVFGGGSFGLVVPAIVALGLLFLLHRSRGGQPDTAEPAGPTGSPAAPPSGHVAGVSLTKDPPAPTPPSWDPLGVAPFAWDLPEPTPLGPPPPDRPRRFPVTALTLAAALLAGGVTALVMLLLGGLTLSNLPVLLAVVLAVVGVGLHVGSFLHTGRGLIPVAVLVAMLTWASAAAPLDGWPAGGFGEVYAAPTTAAELDPRYALSFGDIELDLTDLDLSGPGGPVATRISLGGGEVLITVPEDADVDFTGSVDFGRIDFLGQETDGPDTFVRENDLGEDDERSGRLLQITVDARGGDVEVRRG